MSPPLIIDDVPTRPAVAAASLIALMLLSACGDQPSVERVALDLTVSSPADLPAPQPMTTHPALAPTGPPRFVVTARVPITYFPENSKTAIQTPVPPVVHDATTGAFIADIRLPQGVRGSWQLVAAAPDNRTFLLSGWTGPYSALRFFRVHLSEDGRPGQPELVPGFEGEGNNPGTALALSPDGTRLAYATPVLGGGAKVTVAELATGARRDWATRAFSMVPGLAWAPDGQRLALVGSGWGLGVLDPAVPGSDLLAAARPVKPGKGLWLPQSVAYTPDGAALVYSVGHTVERLALREGAAPEVLARVALPPDASLSLRFSLDGTGRYLLHTHGRRFYRVDLQDGSTTSLPIEVGAHPGEDLSPNAVW
ncbi:WD40 repeat domain-containing protein [Nonomuraea dietziae]|uniref:Uncharacterized protein n=1 Tax=Nonomuraea dietziae TaxID=65515 RepID=A0A7W5VBL1_9ACTN|nr:hypothetical protein [Nonomuraea dietziae]MBB3728599.1 hypothetical protein [Nonomuraea dietziae]